MSYFEGMRLNVKDKADLVYSFYQGKTSEGKFRTVAKCTITCWSFPEELWEHFFNKYNNGDFNTDFHMEITAQCTCSDRDMFDEKLGKRIARKKVLAKYFQILETLTKEAMDAKLSEYRSLCAYQQSVRALRYRTVRKISNLSGGED